MITNGNSSGKSKKKKSAKKPAGKSTSAKKKPVKKKTSKPKPVDCLYEEDFDDSAEFATDKNGDSIDDPGFAKKDAKPGGNGVQIGNMFYQDDSLTPPETESLFAHIIQCDEVYEAAIAELKRIAYKKKREYDLLSNDLDIPSIHRIDWVH